MYNQLIKQANAVGVAANATANIRIPCSGIHFACMLDFRQSGGTAVTSANIATALTNVIVRHDGEQIIEASGQFLLDLQKYYHDYATGAAANVNGIVSIAFAPFHFSTYRERAALAVGTQGMQSFTIDLVFGSSLATVSTVSVYSELYPDVAPKTQYLKIKKFPRTFTQTGNFVVSDLPLENPSVAIKALHITLGSNTGVCDYSTVKVGNFAIWDTIYTNLNTVMANMAQRTPQTAYCHIDFGRNNDLTSFLPLAGVTDLQVLTDWTTAPNNFIIYQEQIAGLNVGK